jgi:hypothetical protein
LNLRDEFSEKAAIGDADAEKAQIKELFEKVADLNKILDKYDIESEVDWSEYWGTVSQYFVTVRYF